MFEMSSGQLSAIVLVIDTEIPAVHKDVLDSFPVCRYHLIIAYLSTTIEIALSVGRGLSLRRER